MYVRYFLRYNCKQFSHLLLGGKGVESVLMDEE
jgi:hypothetical protein